MEKRYPPRSLPEGAKVTRFAPSPTGFVHFGGLFPTKVSERLAHTSGGICYLRIEDTDSKREIEGAAEALIRTLSLYGITFDEGISLDENGNLKAVGDYGPYKQSERVAIYHVYAKQLVREGKAYPCFTTEEELEELHNTDKKAEIKSREWTAELEAEQKAAMLKMREFTIEEVEEHIKAGHPFVLVCSQTVIPTRSSRSPTLSRVTSSFPKTIRMKYSLSPTVFRHTTSHTQSTTISWAPLM